MKILSKGHSKNSMEVIDLDPPSGGEDQDMQNAPSRVQLSTIADGQHVVETLPAAGPVPSTNNASSGGENRSDCGSPQLQILEIRPAGSSLPSPQGTACSPDIDPEINVSTPTSQDPPVKHKPSQDDHVAHQLPSAASGPEDGSCQMHSAMTNRNSADVPDSRKRPLDYDTDTSKKIKFEDDATSTAMPAPQDRSRGRGFTLSRAASVRDPATAPIGAEQWVAHQSTISPALTEDTQPGAASEVSGADTWEPHEYIALARSCVAALDYDEFQNIHRKSPEEVQEVLSAIVVAPLLQHNEGMSLVQQKRDLERHVTEVFRQQREMNERMGNDNGQQQSGANLGKPTRVLAETETPSPMTAAGLRRGRGPSIPSLSVEQAEDNLKTASAEFEKAKRAALRKANAEKRRARRLAKGEKGGKGSKGGSCGGGNDASEFRKQGPNDPRKGAGNGKGV